MKPYQWMTGFTPQVEWIDRQGLLLWLAFFFSEIGAGMYLVSLFLAFWRGCFVGLLISGILGGGLHLLYLGKPRRAWRIILRPKSSELSRGMIFMILFIVIGAIHIAPAFGFFNALPWRSNMLFFQILMPVLCFLVIIHGFMTLSVMKALPSWNSSILPVLSMASGIWIGTQITIGCVIWFSEPEILPIIEQIARWSLFSYTFLLVYYFWCIGHSSLAGQHSFKTITRGDLSLLFYVGVVLIGLTIPIILTFILWSGSDYNVYPLVYLRIICAVIGDSLLRYVILKAGRYFPLLYSNVILS